MAFQIIDITKHQYLLFYLMSLPQLIYWRRNNTLEMLASIFSPEILYNLVTLDWREYWWIRAVSLPMCINIHLRKNVLKENVDWYRSLDLQLFPGRGICFHFCIFRRGCRGIAPRPSISGATPGDRAERLDRTRNTKEANYNDNARLAGPGKKIRYVRLLLTTALALRASLRCNRLESHKDI